MMARLEGICAINMGQSPDSSTYNEDGNKLVQKSRTEC